MTVFNWNESTNIKGTTYCADILDRAKYAVFLTNHLVGEGEHRNYVLNLNAKWGAGKTYFIKRWSNELKGKYPVVYIDAWAHDFSDDPLLTTVSAIIEQLKSQSGSTTDEMIRESSGYLLNLFKKTAPIITKSVVKKLSGIDTDEVNEALTEDDASKEEGVDINAELAEKLTAAILEDHEQKAKSIVSFQKTISQWVTNATNTGELSTPAFIFIDELDRCRPTYAIEMLETIKHLFCMEKVVFVIATDTQQLQHSIKVVYGNDFDAETYLGRFFNRRLSLPAPDHTSFIKTLPQSEHLTTLIAESKWSVMPYYQTPDETIETIGNFFKHYNLDLRTVERIFDQLFSILHQVNESLTPKSIDLIFTVALLCWKENDIEFYEMMKNKNVSYARNISTFLRDYPQYKQHHIHSFKVKFHFYTSPSTYSIIFPSEPSILPHTREIQASEYIRYRYGLLVGQRANAQEILDNASQGQEVSHHELMELTIETNEETHPKLSLEEYIDLVELANLFDA